MNEPAGEDNQRSCMGCRQTDAREALLRFVVAGEPPRLVPDVRRKQPGRGVSVHPRYRCVEAAVRTGAFRRAVGGEDDASAPALAQVAADQYLRRAEGLLLAARRAKLMAMGTESVRDSMTARKAQLLIVAADAEGSRGDLQRAAERLGRSCLVWSTKDGLGRLFGRTTLSVLAILDTGIADALRRALECAAELVPYPPSSVQLSAGVTNPPSGLRPSVGITNPPSGLAPSAVEES